MLTRRHLFYSGFATGCSMCASLVTGSLSHGLAAQAVLPTEIDGPGYKLWFVGSLREAVMMGKRTALLDLRTLKDQPHLYGIGPIEGLAAIKGNGWGESSAATSTITPCRPTVRYCTCSSTMSPISRGERCGVAVKRIGSHGRG